MPVILSRTLHYGLFLLKVTLGILLIVAVTRGVQAGFVHVGSMFMWFVVFGFIAQLIDGALGMAYGVTCTSFLLGFGIQPRVATAVVHIAEVFTTGASGLAHLRLHNIDKKLFSRIVFPGVVGSVVGAYAISEIFDGTTVKPFIAGYLLILGALIIKKALRKKTPKIITVRHAERLALFGGCMDSIGGGGWGPIVASNIIHQGNDPRMTIGTVNAAEFFVTFFGSIVFFLFVGVQNWDIVLAIVIGGIIASPFGAYLAAHIERKKFMIIIGIVIVLTSMVTIIQHLRA